MRRTVSFDVLSVKIDLTDSPIGELKNHNTLAIFFASVGEFSEMGHQILLTEFYPGSVTMATKFKTKWAIPRLVQQLSPRSLHLTEVRVEGLAIR